MTHILGIPRTFGRLVNHDPRSRSYGIVANPSVRLRTVMWDNHAPVLDQGSVGSCTGNAMAQWLNTTHSQTASDGWLVEEDAVAIYSRATQLDGIDGEYPPTDTGSDGNSVAKAAREKSLISGWKHAFGFNQLLQALQSGPVMVGTVWLTGMNEPVRGSVLSVSGDEEGGHEYLIRGCDMDSEYVTMLNSWSDQWGDGGSAHISFRDMDALLRAQGDVTVPVL